MMTQKITNTVLLVMDVQATTIASLGDHAPSFLERIKATIDHARIHKIPVVYCVVGFRNGYPEVSERNKMFTNFINSGIRLDTEAAMEIDPSIAPEAGEPVVIKKRISAFAGSDMDVILSAYNAHHLVLTGLSTSGVVLSTLRAAADKDYQLTVLSDCCADRDLEVHHVLLDKVFPRQADVITHEEWINGNK